MAIIIKLLVETLSKGTPISISTAAPQARVETSQHQLPVVWKDMEEFLEVSPHFSANSLPGPQMVRKNNFDLFLEGVCQLQVNFSKPFSTNFKRFGAYPAAAYKLNFPKHTNFFPF